MSKLNKNQSILNWINTHHIELVSPWLIKIQQAPIANYQAYTELADTWDVIRNNFSFKELQAVETCSFTANEMYSALNKVWTETQRNYFKQQYVDEILATPHHPLHQVLSDLKQGIHSFNDYEKMELRWNREVTPFYLTTRSDSTFLIKTTLGKLYTEERNRYANTIIEEEIEVNPQHPLYALNQLVQHEEQVQAMNAIDIEVLLQNTERSISQLSTQHRSYLNPFYRKLFIKLKEIQYPIQTSVNRRWKICVSDIKQHPEWLLTNKWLTEFLDQKDSFTTESLAKFEEGLDQTREERQKEMSSMEFEWIENEWNKHLRLCKKRLVDEENNKFGNWLASARQEKGLTLQELSTRTNISTSYLHKLEKYGRKSPSITTIRRIVNALELPFNEVAELLGIAMDTAPVIQEVEVIKPNPDLLASLNQEECIVGETKLSKQSRQSLKELLSFIYSKKFNPDALQDSLKVIELVKEALV